MNVQGTRYKKKSIPRAPSTTSVTHDPEDIAPIMTAHAGSEQVFNVPLPRTFPPPEDVEEKSTDECSFCFFVDTCPVIDVKTGLSVKSPRLHKDRGQTRSRYGLSSVIMNNLIISRDVRPKRLHNIVR